MFNYLAFLYGGLPEASEDAFADGEYLAQRCLTKHAEIDNPEQFPPGLLILLTSPAYGDVAEAQNLLDGVHHTFARDGHPDVPLIGCSVAAVFYEGQLYERGALLVCLASRMLEAQVAVSPNARNEAEPAAEALLNQLQLNFTGQGRDPNPLVNRLLLTFLPGFGAPDAGAWYPAPDIHWHLRQKVRARVPIVGGGAGLNDLHRPGMQYAGRSVYVDALVGARLTTGFPFTSSIGHGLSPTGKFWHVMQLDKDKRTILKFKEGTPAEGGPADLLGLHEPEKKALLGVLSLDHDPVVDVAWRAAEGNGAAIRLLRDVEETTSFEELTPEPGNMRREARELFERSLHRLRVEHPIGCLGIHCNGRREVMLSIGDMTDDVKELLQGNPYVGGYFDGEIGLGETGRSLFGNWCVATVGFGDEMRERTPFYQGFEAMSKYFAERAKKLSSVEQAIEHSLEMVWQSGYPGALISLLLENGGRQLVVAHRAVGSQFESICKQAQVQAPYSDDCLLARIARGDHPRLIPNSQEFSADELPGGYGAKLISQYVVPLKALDGNILGFLQFDLGDVRYKPNLQEGLAGVLDSLGAVVETNIARLISREQIKQAGELELALKNSLSAPTVQKALQRFIEEAARIFGAQMGHVRVLRPEDDTLVLAAGTGAYFEALRRSRWKLPRASASPSWLAFTRAGDKRDSLVCNDAAHDDWFSALRRQHAADPVISAALEQVGAYANVVIEDEHGAALGTVNLIAAQPWFFTDARVRSLKALGQRVGYLLGHLRRRRNMEFLSQVSTGFVRYADFSKPLETMNDAVYRCCKAANAEIAGLYLWDPEVKQFILRAQHGWANPSWVDAARYGESECWTGRVAVSNQPQYQPDLCAHLEELGIQPKLHYAQQILGTRLKGEMPVEALGLPLKLKQRNLGVLVLLRRVNLEQVGLEEGFTTTDPAVLQDAADNLATMVSAQLYNLRVRWVREEMERHAKVCEAVQTPGENTPEEALCREMIRSFRATRASLYLVTGTKAAPALTWATGFRRVGRSEEALPSGDADEKLIQALLEKQLVEQQHMIPQEGWADAEIAKHDGLVERVCLLLRSRQHVIGVLDLHWGLNRRQVRPMLALHNRDQLNKLGREAGGAYQRQKELDKKKQARRQAERAKQAAQTMGVMLFQTGHRLLNLTQDLRAMPNLLAHANGAPGLQTRIAQLAQLINSATEQVKRPMETGQAIKNIKPKSYPLRALLDLALLEPEIHNKRLVEVQLHLTPADLQVWVDQNLIREAFRNVVHNALKAMPGGGTLKISARVSKDGQTAHLVFADSGVGMDPVEIKAALSGFVSTQGSTGLGVLVSQLLVRASHGDLRIESQKGQGTQVIIDLPIEPVEEEL